jgi:hypothetical protein
VADRLDWTTRTGVFAAEADSVRLPTPHQTAHETLLRPHTLTPIHEHPRGADSAFSRTPSGALLLLANMDGKALPALSQRSVDAVVMLLRVVGDSLARILWIQHFDQAAGDTVLPVADAPACYSLAAVALGGRRLLAGAGSAALRRGPARRRHLPARASPTSRTSSAAPRGARPASLSPAST